MNDGLEPRAKSRERRVENKQETRLIAAFLVINEGVFILLMIQNAVYWSFFTKIFCICRIFKVLLHPKSILAY